MAGSLDVVVKFLSDFTGMNKGVTDAGKNAQGVAKTMHSAFSGVLSTLNATGVLGPFGGALQNVNDALDTIASHGKSLGPLMLGVGGAMAGIGAALQAAGSKDQAAHQQLQAAVEATGQSYEDYGGQVDAAIKGQEKYGRTAAETQDALRILTQATHDPGKALALLATSANVAAAKHEGLDTAATQVGKVFNGNTKLLKEYGITVDKNTKLTGEGQTALQALADVTSGQASAAADTFMGKLDGIKAKLEDTFAAIGQRYGPAITSIGSLMAGLGAAWSVISAIMAADWFAAFWPIGLIVLAIAGVGVAVYLLRDKFVAAFEWIKGVMLDVWRWIQTNWPMLLAILLGPISAAAYFIWKFFGQDIKQWASDAVNGIKAVWDGLVGFFTGLPGRIASIASGMWDGILRAFEGMVNGIIDIWNSLHFTLPKIDAGPIHIGGETIGVPQIPHLAQGGLITQTGLIYAHAGEAVTPASARNGPAVHIEHASFSSDVDVDAFMRRVAWTLRTQRV